MFRLPFRRPITTTTPRNVAEAIKSEMKTTTPLPMLMSSFATASKKTNQPSYVSLKLDQERALVVTETNDNMHHNQFDNEGGEHEDEEINASQGDDDVQARDLANEEVEHEVEEVSQQENSEELHEDHDETLEQDENKSTSQQIGVNNKPTSNSHDQEESDELMAKEKSLESYEIENTPEMPAVEVRLKEISQEVEKRNNEENRHIPSLTSDLDDIGRQSFLSLTDLIRTLHPNDKQIIPQIDSDYSNAMRVLGEKSVVVNTNDE